MTARLAELRVVTTRRPPKWMERALCKGADPELFFPEQGEDGKTAMALRICRRCPVRVNCLIWALRTGQDYGIYGGKTPRQRKWLLRKRRITSSPETGTPAATRAHV